MNSLFVDGFSKHHKKDEEDVKIVWFIHSFMNFCKQLAKDISTSLLIYFFVLVILRFLFLRVEVDVNIVKITLCVYFLESTVIFPFLNITNKVTKPVNAIGSNILSITVTVVYLFLSLQ